MTTTAKIKLDKAAQTVTVDKLTTADSIFYQLMDQTAASERQDMLASVLHIGARTGANLGSLGASTAV